MRSHFFYLRRSGRTIGFITLLIVGFTCSYAQNIWVQEASFGVSGREGPTGFSIGSKGYMGTGADENGNFFKDFWEYDPGFNIWTQKADFGGAERFASIGFSIAGNGYIGTGYNGNYLKDFWEYNPGQNLWTQKADLAGTGRSYAIGFSMGDKGYAGTGFMFDANSNYFNDFWEYDPASDTWTPKADFAGADRYGAVGFSIGTTGYVGTGYSSDGMLHKDFWEYDLFNDSWAQKSDFGGNKKSFAVGFSIGNKGYLGTGEELFPYYTKDFWEYDPSSDLWTQKADLGGPVREIACGFSIGGEGYIGTGLSFDAGTIYLNDFWKYDPDSAVGIHETTSTSSFSIFPNPTSEKISIHINLQLKESLTLKVLDLAGRELYSENIGNLTGTFSKQLDLQNFSAGTYLVRMIHNGQPEEQKIILSH